MTKISSIRMFLCAIIVTVTGLVVVSCGSSPVDKGISIIEEATEKLKDAKDVYEVLGITNQMKADLNSLNAAHRDYKPSEAEAKRIQKALSEYMRASMKRTTEVSGVSPEVQQQTQEAIDKLLPK